MGTKSEHNTNTPHHLSQKSRQLWSEIVPRRAKSPERLALVQTALEALDRADEAGEVVRKEGLTTKTKTTGAVHIHPLLKIEKESRQFFARVWNQLGFSWDWRLDGGQLGDQAWPDDKTDD